MALTAEFLAAQIQGLHYGIAIIANNSVWQLTDSESALLADAISHCADAYSISVDPRVMAMGELIGVCAMIYIPRYLAVRAEAQHRSNPVPPVMPDPRAASEPSYIQ